VGLEEDDTEGGMIELFKDAKNRIALDIDGKPDWWWLRTPYSASSRHVRRVNSDGTLSSLHNAYNGHFGLRPACNIKITYLVSKGGKGMRDNDNLIEGMMQGIPVKVSENERLIIVTPNMTAKQYAATKLKVPRSGDPDIDAMIRESRRADFAQEIMSGLLAGTYYALDKAVAESFSKRAFCVANVMLAEWEKVEPL
jgi:hypothetical protein